jgi:hypothetical protein
MVVGSEMTVSLQVSVESIVIDGPRQDVAAKEVLENIPLMPKAEAIISNSF